MASLLQNNARAFINLTDLFRRTERLVFADNIHFIALDKNLKSFGNYRLAVEIVHKLEKDNQITARPSSIECMAGYEPK